MGIKKLAVGAVLGVAYLTAFAAGNELRIISAGSKTGSLSMQAVAYSKDLGNSYSINTIIPGNFCEALSLIDDTTPTIFLWGHDFEAAYRNGKCESKVPFKLTQDKVIRFDKSVSAVCSIKYGRDDFIRAKEARRVGHTTPKEMFTYVIDNINKHFDTSHKSIPYNGNGLVRLALINGEVDYAMVTAEHAAFIKENKGNCFFVLDTPSKQFPGVESLQNLIPDANVSQSFDNRVFALNMSPEQRDTLVKEMRAKGNQCESYIGQYTKCNTTVEFIWDITDVENKRWTTDVNSLIMK